VVQLVHRQFENGHGRLARTFAVAMTAAYLLSAAASPARAHIPELRGKLVDLVRRSDVIVIGTVQRCDAVKARVTNTTLSVDQTLVGQVSEPNLSFRGPTRFAPAGRYVFFLRRTASGFEGIQSSGSAFPSRTEDDAAYRQTIGTIREALRAGAEQQLTALRSAMIAALSASASALRYHAALELAALAHHAELTAAEHDALERLGASPATDPALRPLISTLLQPTPAAASRSSPGSGLPPRQTPEPRSLSPETAVEASLPRPA